MGTKNGKAMSVIKNIRNSGKSAKYVMWVTAMAVATLTTVACGALPDPAQRSQPGNLVSSRRRLNAVADAIEAERLSLASSSTGTWFESSTGYVQTAGWLLLGGFVLSWYYGPEDTYPQFMQMEEQTHFRYLS